MNKRYITPEVVELNIAIERGFEGSVGVGIEDFGGWNDNGDDL